MLPDRVSNPGTLAYESGALPIALRGPARSSHSYSTMCSSFPHKSKQVLFSVFQLCSGFCGKLLYIVEKYLDEWLSGIMRGYVHFIA